MPVAFDRFRLLNGGKRLRNETARPAYVRPTEHEPQVIVPPGGEQDLPFAADGSVVVEFETEDPPASGG